MRVSLKFGCFDYLQLLLQLWGPVSRMSSIWSLCCRVLVEIALLQCFLYKNGTKVTCHMLAVVKHKQSRTFVPSHICMHTYLLTLWCRVLLEKLTGLQLVKKFPAFYGTQRFITAFTSSANRPCSGLAQSSPHTHNPPAGDPS